MVKIEIWEIKMINLNDFESFEGKDKESYRKGREVYHKELKAKHVKTMAKIEANSIPCDNDIDFTQLCEGEQPF